MGAINYRLLGEAFMTTLIRSLSIGLFIAGFSQAAELNKLTPQEDRRRLDAAVRRRDDLRLDAGQHRPNWKVADGVISVSAGEPGLLCTTSEFADYVLKVDFRCPKGTNSGVFLRTPMKPQGSQEPIATS